MTTVRIYPAFGQQRWRWVMQEGKGWRGWLSRRRGVAKTRDDAVARAAHHLQKHDIDPALVISPSENHDGYTLDGVRMVDGEGRLVVVPREVTSAWLAAGYTQQDDGTVFPQLDT